jgi:methylmalonyl-CoA mutase cobalamin-binding subunit
MDRKAIDRIVREVMKENGFLTDKEPSDRSHARKHPTGPSVLFVFHGGIRYLKKALAQVREIDALAGRSSVFTAEPARPQTCGVDIKTEAGIRCCLDNVKPDLMERALAKTDILVLPTFCLKTAARIASLAVDTTESAIVLSALARGKKVLATRDGFTLLDILANNAIQKEMDRILDQMEDFGMTFCNTDVLSAAFEKMVAAHRPPPLQEKGQGHPKPDGLTLVTAKDIQAAANSKQPSILVAPGGIVTPLAKDHAKEYAVKIRFQNSINLRRKVNG